MLILALPDLPDPEDFAELWLLLKQIWPGVVSGVVLKWISALGFWGTVAVILPIVFLGYLVLRNQRKKKQKNDSRPGTRSDVVQVRVPPDAAPGGRDAAPTPADGAATLGGAGRNPQME
jgi:hypothetical protein